MSTIHWLSVSEVAERLGIKGDTVYTWIQSRGLPGHRLGRIWRFDAQEVDAWVRSGEAAAPSRRRRRKAGPKKKAGRP